MKLVHEDILNPIFLNENKVNVVIIENASKFREYIYELKTQFDKKEGRFPLVDDIDVSLYENAYLISSYFDVINLDKVLNKKLIEKIISMAKDDEHLSKSLEIRNQLVAYISDLVFDMDVDASFEVNIGIDKLIKLFSFDFDLAEEPKYSLLDFMLIVNKLLDINIFMFIGIRTFFSLEELKEIYKFSFNNKFQLILFEKFLDASLEEEDVFIIDEDSCEIY